MIRRRKLKVQTIRYCFYPFYIHKRILIRLKIIHCKGVLSSRANQKVQEILSLTSHKTIIYHKFKQSCLQFLPVQTHLTILKITFARNFVVRRQTP